jgi:hypothetical protein
MDYKGIEYLVVQAADANAWKWTVFVDAKPIKTGSSGSCALAINAAQARIRKHLKTEERMELVLSAEVSAAGQS